MQATTVQSTPTQAWIEAARPRTLPLALASILMGAFLAAADGLFSLPVTLLCILTTIFLQILSNLANDYGDSIHGADSSVRIGPLRAVQSGRITRSAMQRGMVLVTLLAASSGLLLVWAAVGTAQLPLALAFIILGGAAITAAITYTAGARPYGYAGLGDLSVLIFFGWLGVIGAYYLQTLTLNWTILLPATSCGFFAVAVLNINNIRDIDSDRQAGKRSIPVRIGRRNACLYHWVLLGVGFAAAVAYVLFNYHSPWQFLFVCTLPLLVRNGLAVSRTSSHAMDSLLKQMSLTTLTFVITFGIGQLI